jgi:hypothetical protein
MDSCPVAGYGECAGPIARCKEDGSRLSKVRNLGDVLRCERQLEGLYLGCRGVRYYVSLQQLGTPETRAGSMEAANDWWRRKQEEIDHADPFVQARADLEAIKDHIDENIYKRLLRWIDRGEPEYLQRAQEKIEFLTEFHRKTWGQIDLPEEGSGEGLDELV